MMDHSGLHGTEGEMMQKGLSDQNKDDLLRQIGEIFPDFLTVITEGRLRDKVWSRTVLAQRERIMITLALLVVTRCDNVLRAHIRDALNKGITREEILEVIYHTAHYTLWGYANEAIRIAAAVFSDEE